MKSKITEDLNQRTFMEDELHCISLHSQQIKYSNYLLALNELKATALQSRQPRVGYNSKTTKGEFKIDRTYGLGGLSEKVNEAANSICSAGKSIVEFSEASKDKINIPRNSLSKNEIFNNGTICKLEKLNKPIAALEIVNLQKQKQIERTNTIKGTTKSSTCNKSNQKSTNSSVSNKGVNFLKDLDEEVEIAVEKNKFVNNYSSNSQSEDECERKKNEKRKGDLSEILVIETDLNEAVNDFKRFNLNFGDKYLNEKDKSSSKRRKKLESIFQKSQEKIAEHKTNRRATTENIEQSLVELESDNSLFYINNSLNENPKQSALSKKASDKMNINIKIPGLSTIAKRSCKTERVMLNEIDKSFQSPQFSLTKQKSLISQRNDLSRKSFKSINKNLNFMNQSGSKSFCSLVSDQIASNSGKGNKIVNLNLSSLNNTPKPKRASIEEEKTCSRPYLVNHKVEDSFVEINEEEFVPCPIYDIEFIQNLIDSDANYKPNYTQSEWLLQENFADYSYNRAIVLNWLMEISEEYGFRRDTYYNSMNLFDRFIILRNGHEEIKDFQMIVCACMLICSKIEEIQVPRAEEYINSAGFCFSIDELLYKERTILNVLKLINNKFRLCLGNSTQLLLTYGSTGIFRNGIYSLNPLKINLLLLQEFILKNRTIILTSYTGTFARCSI